MAISKKILAAKAIKLFIEKEDKEIGHAYIYLINNDLCSEPYAFMEDVFVDESYRGKRLGTELIKKLIETAKENGCYKIVATSRYGRENVHRLYKKLGFKDWGKEFRMDLK